MTTMLETEPAMLILVINSGSSSIKYQLFDASGGFDLLAKGAVDRIGVDGSSIVHEARGRADVTLQMPLPDHRAALGAIGQAIVSPEHGVIIDIKQVGGIGHRFVHGGEKFASPTLITDAILEELRQNTRLAPLHNPANILGVEVCRHVLPDVPNVAVFDTAMHQTIPPKAFLYGLPMDLYKHHGIRKYGFHGTSHGYVAGKAAELLNKPFEQCRLITCHLGNGCSVTAFQNGKSVDTSMGLTPLEGVMMGTRCGDLDPAAVLYMMDVFGLNTQQANDLLNKEGGLKGLCGESDMRDIIRLAEAGDANARTALDVFVYRIRKYIGAYIAVMGGADAIVFTAGIGENSSCVREEILTGFEYIGLGVDQERNRQNASIFSTAESKVLAMVIPTNEELVIGRQTHETISSHG
jgi:acetate kinase